MGPHLEQKGETKTRMDISDTRENGTIPQDPEDKTMLCASNFEDHSFDVEAIIDNVPGGREDKELDIIGCTSSGDPGIVEAECQDATENSSSFDDTVSGPENGLVTSDHEVESPFDDTLPFEGYDGVLRMRKRRLTDHWRRFIRPLMWRCKWIELRVKEFQSQALKYDKELAEYDQQKQSEFEKFAIDGVDTRSQPFSGERQKIMKRKKRKRIEETTDIASYMSHHNMFSYYESRKSAADGAVVDDICGKAVMISTDHKTINGNDEIGVNHHGSLLEFKDCDSYLDQILWKIEMAQSETRKLKSRVDKVLSEYPGKFSSVNKLSWFAPCDALTSSDQNPASPPKNGDRMPVTSLYTSSQHVSEGNVGDILMPESAVSSHGEVTPLPDMMIRNTGQGFAGASSEAAEEGIPLHHQATKEDLHNFERVINQLTVKPQESMEILTVSPPSRSRVPTKKRKQGKRKSGPWRRKSSG
ncbi:uncharacterized protein LOC110822254 isoform X2 [Carica papaya]|uniref:uncharacterized protein LOC110822254 isoform X2 n=1 Tax=Carica papaya TaxID=3649 RepID=UPI000B8CB8DB|nr:uncharacterized protein LOC110822254 isoform X2 [Carica papaya]